MTTKPQGGVWNPGRVAATAAAAAADRRTGAAAAELAAENAKLVRVRAAAEAEDAARGGGGDAAEAWREAEAAWARTQEVLEDEAGNRAQAAEVAPDGAERNRAESANTAAGTPGAEPA